MIFLKIIVIAVMVFILLFLLSLVIYFFNLDMKLACKLIKPLTKYYDWSKARREKKHRNS